MYQLKGVIRSSSRSSSRSPPGVTTVPMGFLSIVGLNHKCDTAYRPFFGFVLEKENSKIVKSSGEATCKYKRKACLTSVNAYTYRHIGGTVEA